MDPIIIAGPCAAESKEQLFSTAEQLGKQFLNSEIKLSYFRAGVWKARSNPNAFKGVGEVALPWLDELSTIYKIPVCVEIAKPKHIEQCLKNNIRAVWIGSRTVVNPFVVQELAEAAQGSDITIMIKNPLIPDFKLWTGAIERFFNSGVNKVMAIHRGFSDNNEKIYRNNPLWELAIDFKVKYPEIPLICDPSHIAGKVRYIEKIAQIALNYGFNGLMIETHCCPAQALSDAEQQITPQRLKSLLSSLVFKSQTTEPGEEELRVKRNLIEGIDAQIAELLAKRMSIVDEIAVIKRKYNLPLVQPQQWQKAINSYHEVVLKDENFLQFIEKFLELLHQQSLERQKKLMN
jgi:chorismate mutase